MKGRSPFWTLIEQVLDFNKKKTAERTLILVKFMQIHVNTKLDQFEG